MKQHQFADSYVDLDCQTFVMEYVVNLFTVREKAKMIVIIPGSHAIRLTMFEQFLYNFSQSFPSLTFSQLKEQLTTL